MPDASHHIRDLAYRLWEEEGRPEGREAEHWLIAERRLQSDEAAREAPVKKAKKSAPRTVKTAAAPKRSTRAATKSGDQASP